MTASQREFKGEKSSSYPFPLTADAFKRPVEVKGEATDRADFLQKIYETKPEYALTLLYHEQIQKLASVLETIAKDFKEFSIEGISNITEFPQYLQELITTNPDTVPYGTIKETLEKLTYLLQKKIIIDKNKIQQQFKERKIELSDDELQVEIEIEEKDAAEYEVRKSVCLTNLLPYLLMCDTGIAGHLDFALEYLSGGDTLDEIWCKMRTQYVTDFGLEHLRTHEIDEGSEIHVPIVLRNYALEKKWAIRSEMENLKDHFHTTTEINSAVLNHFEMRFYDIYQLRSMTEAAAKKFEELFFRDYARKFKGKDFKQEHKGDAKERKHTEERRYDWITFKDASIFSCAEEIYKKWDITTPGKDGSPEPVSGTNAFELKDETTLRFSPLRFKQFFWQYCRLNNRFVRQDSWIEEKVFKDFRLFHSKAPNSVDCAWIENKEGEIVSFDNLPAEEQRRYFIYSTIQFGSPDRFKWLTPSPRLTDIFKERKDYAELAKALNEEKQWEKHRILMSYFFNESPQLFFEMLELIHEKDRLAILESTGIDFHWLHPGSNLYGKLLKLISEGSWLEAQLKIKQEQFEKFQTEHKLDPKTIPIRFSELLELAKSPKSDDQPVFRMYLQRYYPMKYCQTLSEVKPDFASYFVEAFEENTAQMEDTAKQIRWLIQNGDLETLQKMEISNVDIFSEITWMLACGHNHLIDYFYKKICIAPSLEGIKKEFLPLLWLIKFDKDNPEIEMQLEEKTMNLDESINDGINNGTLLHYATSRLKWVKKLISYQANVNAQTDSLETPLYFASEDEYIDCVRVLLENGSQIDQQDDRGKPPLLAASQAGFLDIVRLLLLQGASVNLADNNGNSPLHGAAQSGHLAIVQLLLEMGAQINLETNNGGTPLFLAAQEGHPDIVQFLLDQGALITSTIDGYNALHVAAEEGHLDIVLLLLERGIDINLQPNEGATPLFLAAEAGQLDIVQFLLNQGANPTFFCNNTTSYQIASDPYIRQLLSAAEAKFYKNEIQEEAIFSHYRLCYDKYLYQGMKGISTQGWIKNEKDEIISFDDVPEDERMQYHIISTLEVGFPDRFYLLGPMPSPTLLEIFTEKKDLQALAGALKKDNRWEKHKNVLTYFLHESPSTFVSILEALNDEKLYSQIFDLVDINFALLHPKDFWHGSISYLASPETKDEKLRHWLTQHWSQPKSIFDNFQNEHKLNPEEIPIPYSKLLEIAPRAKPSEQFIFKLYLQRYYPAIYQKVVLNDLIDFAKAFLDAHQNNFDSFEEERDQQISLYIQHGNLEGLREMELSIEEIYKYVRLMHQGQHRAMLDHFYQIALTAYTEDSSPYNAPLLYLMVLFNQEENDNETVVAQLALEDLDVNELCDDYDTPLHAACDFGLIGWVKRLCEFEEINVNLQNEHGTTPLCAAAQQGHLDIVRILLEKGADFDLMRKDGATPLFLAAQEGYLDVVTLLLNYGADHTLSCNNLKAYQATVDPKIKRLLLGAAIRFELKNLITPEIKESKGHGLFDNEQHRRHQQYVHFIAEALQDFLNEKLSKETFVGLQSSFEKTLNSEPWASFYLEARRLAFPDQEPRMGLEKKS